jgi:hypothetical protein
MPFRVLAASTVISTGVISTGVISTVLATVMLLAPAAGAAAPGAAAPGAAAPGAAAPGTVQVSGVKLASALVPASEFGPHYEAGFGANSGSKLSHQPAVHKPASMSCRSFWALYSAPGYGETAQAFDSVATTGSGLRLYVQAVYQMPASSAASALYAAEDARYRGCPSFTTGEPGPGGITITVTQHVSRTQVDGHQAFLVDQRQAYPGTAGSTTSYVLATVDGADLFIVTYSHDATAVPAGPTPTAVIGKLIARVAALR